MGRARARACRCAWQARAARPATPCVSGRRRLRRDGSAGLLKLLKLRLIVAAARPPRQLKKRTPGGIETGGTDRGISEPGGCLETANTPPRLRGASAAPAVPELSGAERSRAPRAAAEPAPGLPPRMRGFGPLSYGNSSRPCGHDDSCAAVTAIKLQQGCGRRERLSQLLSTGWDRNAIDFCGSSSRDFGVLAWTPTMIWSSRGEEEQLPPLEAERGCRARTA